MAQKKLRNMSNFFLKRFFGGIPRIVTKFKDLPADELANFEIKQNSEFDLQEEDSEYAEMVAKAPEYRIEYSQVDSLYVLESFTPFFTDPAWHPYLHIYISNLIKDVDLIVVGALLHELTHYYCWYLGYDYHDGDKQFEDKLKEFGFPSNFDRRFEKSTRSWVDDYDYGNLKKYLEEFEKEML